METTVGQAMGRATPEIALAGFLEDSGGSLPIRGAVGQNQLPPRINFRHAAFGDRGGASSRSGFRVRHLTAHFSPQLVLPQPLVLVNHLAQQSSVQIRYLTSTTSSGRTQ